MSYEEEESCSGLVGEPFRAGYCGPGCVRSSGHAETEPRESWGAAEGNSRWYPSWLAILAISRATGSVRPNDLTESVLFVRLPAPSHQATLRISRRLRRPVPSEEAGDNARAARRSSSRSSQASVNTRKCEAEEKRAGDNKLRLSFPLEDPYSPECVERLSEKPWKHPWRSPTERGEGSFGPISAYS